jgi:hypothetical protein
MQVKKLYQASKDTPWSQSMIRRFRRHGLTDEEIEEIQRISHLRQERAENRPLSQADLARALQARTVKVIRTRYEQAALAAIRRNIEGCDVTTTLDLAKAAALVTVEGWAQYSRRFGARRTRVVMLVVYDHDTRTRRALRVSPKVRTVAEALESIKPAAVRRAENLGVEVYRQGDYYFVPSRRPDYRALEGTRHEVVNGVVVHPEHRPLNLPGPCKAYRQKTVGGTYAD